jgi:hypothetical protein
MHPTKIDSLLKQYEESLKTQHGNEYAGNRQCLDAEKCFFTAFNQKIRRSASNSGAFHTSTSFRQQKLRGKCALEHAMLRTSSSSTSKARP